MVEKSNTKKVALVLSSGGARGIAHIGVIQELEARGYTITSVAGTSIGAVIGGFHAAGKLDEYADWICGLGLYNVFNLIDFSFGGKGVIKGQKVFEKMGEWMEGLNFKDLRIPFTCIATDLKNRKEIVLNTGDVMNSIRASIAIPGYIEPMLLDDVYLYDGGIINPLPINRVHRNGDEIVVAVDLNAHQPDFDPKEFWESSEPEASPTLTKISEMWSLAVNKIEELHHHTPSDDEVMELSQVEIGHFSRIEALSEMFQLMQENVTLQSLQNEHPEVLISMPRNLCSTFEFHRSKELIAYGRTRAGEALDILEGKMV